MILMCSNFVSSELYHIRNSPIQVILAELNSRVLHSHSFASNTLSYAKSNTTIVLSPGHHYLESELFIADISNLTILSASPFNSAVITCGKLGRFVFETIYAVRISNLNFVRCPGNKVVSVSHFRLTYSSFVGQEGARGTALQLVETSAYLLRTLFYANQGDVLHGVSCFSSGSFGQISHSSSKLAAGGGIVANHSKVTIAESRFQENNATIGGAIFIELESDVTIIDSVFKKNQAIYNQRVYCQSGGGALFADSGSTVTLHNSTFTHNVALGGSGGGVAFIQSGINLTITHCQFAHNIYSQRRIWTWRCSIRWTLCQHNYFSQYFL